MREFSLIFGRLDFVGQLLFRGVLRNVVDGGCGDVVQGLLSQEGGVRGDKYRGERLEHLEAPVPRALSLREGHRRPIAEEQRPCSNPQEPSAQKSARTRNAC